jgi:hypothetical protein
VATGVHTVKKQPSPWKDTKLFHLDTVVFGKINRPKNDKGELENTALYTQLVLTNTFRQLNTKWKASSTSDEGTGYPFVKMHI